MAVAAEIQQEQYARSFSKFREVGAVIVAQEVALHEIDLEAIQPLQQAHEDYVSGVCEMLRSDTTFNQLFDIDGSRTFRIINGRARDKNDDPLVEMVERGHDLSKTRARFQPEFAIQATRDAGDVYTAEQADRLEDGESYFAITMDPKVGLRDHPEIYKDELGYSEGLLYIQRYSKVGNTLVSGYCSVDMSDEDSWREVLAEEGVIIPPGESPDTWIMHGFKAKMTPEQAEKYVLGLRDKYYEHIGVTEKRYSVSEYVARNSAVVDAYFKAYVPALAEAIHTRENNATMQGLAQALLQTDLQNMKADARRHLIKVAGSKSFDDEVGKTMEAIIRYAVVEELRKGLRDVIAGKQTIESYQAAPNSFVALTGTQTTERGSWVVPPEQLNRQFANNVESGVKAGRSYGGCAGQVMLSEAEKSVGFQGLEGVPGRLQQPYADRDNPEHSKDDKINCIKCRKPTNVGQVEQKDKEGKTVSWKCPHCKYEVDICTQKVLNPQEKDTQEHQQQLGEVILLEEVRRTRQAATEKLGQKALQAGA